MPPGASSRRPAPGKRENAFDALQKRPWFLFWAPYFALLILFGIDDGTGIAPLWARFGSGPRLSGTSAEAFGHLLDQGPDHRAARAVQRMLASVLPADAARDVVVERFQHWTGRTPASYQLGMVGAPAVPLLTSLLDHDKERVRQQAALALGDIGLAAAPAVPILARLARRSPPDGSSRAAMNALGDVDPSGLQGWFWKVWYEVPLLAVTLIVLVPLFGAGMCGNLAAARAKEPDTPVFVPPAPLFLVAGVLAVALLALGFVDLLGARFTVEADVWALALGLWFVGAVAVGAWVRRQAFVSPASSRSA